MINSAAASIFDLEPAAIARAELVDTHIHFFRRGLPAVDRPRYLPDYDAEASHYLELCAAHGITRAVIVQPSFLGTDNSFMCSLLRSHRDMFRGVAVVKPDVPTEQLDQLASDGVVGIRLNLDSQPIPQFDQGRWPALLQQVRQRNWHVELHREAVDLPLLLGPLLDAGVRIVVDHFGRPDSAAGAGDPGFRHLLQSARTGQVWVKLSAAYRNGPHGAANAARLAGELLQHFGPSHLVWGSDWPHTRHENSASMADLLAQLRDWVPDEKARACILGATPLALFGFAMAGAQR